MSAGEPMSASGNAPLDVLSASGDAPLDVLIVGAGLSGIGAAVRLQQRCPAKRFAIVEARDTLGGTWDLFRYPGVRSDSDMYTLAYPFRPWTGERAIAGGAAILDYLRATADEAGLTPLIRFGHAVRAAAWSSADACWTVRIERRGGEPLSLRARFLYLCCGYYRYAEGHRPVFDGEAQFAGRIVHPQFWPADLPLAGRRVVVVGSGATAVTLAPALAEAGATVTLLQRSPSYVVALPSRDRLALWLRRRLPSRAAHALARWKNALRDLLLYQLARRRPELIARRIVELARAQVGPGFDAAAFTPRYRPWDQRMCVAADGDLFRQMRAGRVALVTDRIERFGAGGLLLQSGRELAADVIVLATGLQLSVVGDIAFTVDGRPFDAGGALSYKGMMLSDLPNLAAAFGYINASWTLKADLTAGFVCRLLRHMDRHGYAVATPRGDPQMPRRPFVDFSSGYVQRSIAQLPKQGTAAPWRVRQNYVLDLLGVRFGRLADGVLQFARR